MCAFPPVLVSLCVALIKPVMKPSIRKVVSWTVRGPAWRVDFAVRFHDGPFVVNFAHALAQIAEKFVERLELLLGGFPLIEIAYQTDAESDII